jgi:S-adenosylmethionine:tRNA ribosyltransferase-isomerase
MLHPKDISINDFTYPLPDEKIARFPLEERDASKLLVFNNGEISDQSFRDLPNRFSKDDLLVFNQTRVVQARLFFYTAAGAKIEVFCLEPLNNKTIPEAMLDQGASGWLCMVGNARKWKANEILRLEIKQNGLEYIDIKLVERTNDGFAIQFNWDNSTISFAELLDYAGFLPLPPYLKRDADNIDKSRYQTVYASEQGSVAAPTAGLHFTSDTFDRLKIQGVACAYVTLHVGAGTFKPVKAARMEEHDMHSEELHVSLDLIESIANCRGKIAAIGTTTLRTLESLYWTSVRLMKNPDSEISIDVSQWEPYQESKEELPESKQAFSFLAELMRSRAMETIQGKTQIIIAPGYTIRTIHVLITNFHQPQSTLLLLVSACIGDDWKLVYEHALQNNYRFLSYGDSSALFVK